MSKRTIDPGSTWDHVRLTLVCPCGREWDADIPTRVPFFPSTTCEVCTLKKKIEKAARLLHADGHGLLCSCDFSALTGAKPPDPPDYFVQLLDAIDAWRQAEAAWPPARKAKEVEEHDD